MNWKQKNITRNNRDNNILSIYNFKTINMKNNVIIYYSKY